MNVAADAMCKYIVSAATLITCVTQTPPDGSSIVVPFVVVMAVACSFAGKGLKRVLGHSRPSGACKKDHGMPSSHAVALSYLSISAAFGLMKVTQNTVFSVLVVLLGAYLSALRYFLGHHLAAQVVVGYSFGASFAVIVLLWLYAGTCGDGPRVDCLPLQVRLCFLYSSAAVCFILLKKMAVKWVQEDFNLKRE
jgi:dolichyldiphosphatase